MLVELLPPTVDRPRYHYDPSRPILERLITLRALVDVPPRHRPDVAPHSAGHPPRLTPAVRRGRPPEYPFHDMQVGQSFTVPRWRVGLVRSAITAHRQRWGNEFCTRAEDNCVRVWRTK